MGKTVTCLWFDDQAEKAAKFYTSVFKNSKILDISRYGDVGPRPKGMVMTVRFVIEGQEFVALNGGPEFKFSPAVSIMVNCRTQKEIDTLWRKLTAGGGQEVECGWLTDKFGLSWQILPADIIKWITNPKSSNRVMAEIHKMKKLDLARLKKAAAGKP